MRSVVWPACNKKARLQRSDVPRTFLTKERRSENVVCNSSQASSDFKIDSNTSIFPVCFYVIHNMSKRSIKDFFNVIQDENSGSKDEEGKLLDRIAGPCRETSTQKYCVWWFYRKFSRSGGTPLKIFSQKNLVQVNSDRMALSILRVSLKVAKWRHSLTARRLHSWKEDGIALICLHTAFL